MKLKDSKCLPSFSSLLVNVLMCVCFSLFTVNAQAQNAITISTMQIESGKTHYKEVCQICHGSTLVNGQFGTPLRGSFFRDKWKGKSVGELQQFIYEKMPPDNVMSLSPAQYSDLLAYLLSRNEILAGETALSTDILVNNAVLLPW